MGGELDLEGLAGEDAAAVQGRLRQLWGVGHWTDRCAAAWAGPSSEVFPGDDTGTAGGLQRWLGLPQKLDYAAMQAVVQRWQPYAGLVYFHLLLKQAGAGRPDYAGVERGSNEKNDLRTVVQ